VYLQKGELQKGGCNSKKGSHLGVDRYKPPRVRETSKSLGLLPCTNLLKESEGLKKTYYTKDELWTTDNSNCTQQQLRVFYTFTLLLIHLVRKFGFPACLCKLVNPHTRLPVEMHASCRNVRIWLHTHEPACRDARKQYGMLALRIKNQSKWYQVTSR